MAKITAAMVEHKISIINAELGCNIRLSRRNGYYALDLAIPGTTAVKDIDSGLTIREANYILKGMMAVVCGDLNVKE